MPATTARMVQLNVRVDARQKEQAAEVLQLMGLTATDVIRATLAKVARGARDCEELLTAIEGPATSEVAPPEERPLSPALADAFEICDSFARLLGYQAAEEMPKDDRSWEEIYEDARMAHYREKGWLS